MYSKTHSRSQSYIREELKPSCFGETLFYHKHAISEFILGSPPSVRPSFLPLSLDVVVFLWKEGWLAGCLCVSSLKLDSSCSAWVGKSSPRKWLDPQHESRICSLLISRRFARSSLGVSLARLLGFVAKLWPCTILNHWDELYTSICSRI